MEIAIVRLHPSKVQWLIAGLLCCRSIVTGRPATVSFLFFMYPKPAGNDKLSCPLSDQSKPVLSACTCSCAPKPFTSKLSISSFKMLEILRAHSRRLNIFCLSNTLSALFAKVQNPINRHYCGLFTATFILAIET